MNISDQSTSNQAKRDDGAHANDATGEQEPSDMELAGMGGQGDVQAFTLLLKRYQNSVYALLYNLSQKAEVADDLTQQTFIKVWRALPAFQQRSAFSTWLYRIAHNVFYDFLRKREPVMEDITSDTFRQEAMDSAHLSGNSPCSPDEAMMTRERLALFRKALSKLSEEHRTVLLLKEVQGLSYKEIAEVTQCSTGTVMSRLHYARQNLRTILHDYEN